MGISMAVTLSIGASKWKNASVSWIQAAISAPTPQVGNPSSTVINLFVFLTLLIIVYLSKGLIVLRLMTSQLIPSLASSSAACNEYLTFLEYPTKVTCFPSLMILAFPIGMTKSLSRAYSLISNFYPYKFSFYKNTTTSFDLMAAFKSPLLSSASYGEMVIRPGILAYQAAKHCECWAATAAAGPLRPLKTIPPCKIPELMYEVFALLLMIWSIAWRAKFHVMNSTIGLSPINDAPTARPVKPASVIGVSLTLSVPNLSTSPLVILYAPWYWPTYSPIIKVFGSRASSSYKAWFKASRLVMNWAKFL